MKQPHLKLESCKTLTFVGREIALNCTRRLLGSTLGLLFAATIAAGQSSNVSQPATDNRQAQANLPDAPSAHQKSIFGVISNVKTVTDPSTPFHPLTSKEKFKLVREFFDIGTLLSGALGAGITQATGGPPDYEQQGAKGYGKRFGAELGDDFTSEVFVTGVFPSLLHEDPRYFRQGAGSFSSRTFHAVSHVVVTRNDSGHNTYNFSQFLGNLTSSAISNAYYPDRERGVGDVFSRAGARMGGDALGLILREFAPDILRKFKRKRQVDPPASAEIPAPAKP